MNYPGILNTPHDTALLFTNNLGQVVFADQGFLNMLNYSDAGVITGEPLFKALRLEQPTARALLERLLKAGRIQDEVLDIRGPGGEPLRITFSGEASYDPSGSFIGADIKLRPVSEAGTVAASNEKITDATPHREIVAEAFSPEHDAFIQLYFTTHIKALYVLLSRLVGTNVQSNLDKSINDLSKQHGWKIHITCGLFENTLSGANVDMYRTLLSKIYDFATNMIGARIVAKEVEKTDAQLHEGVVVLATQSGLRDSFKASR